jgi:hypothetical protein
MGQTIGETMKRITDVTQTSAPQLSTPNIDNLFNAMPPSGMESYEDQMRVSAVLGFYFDGVDYSGQSIRKISALTKRMDAEVPKELGIEYLDDEDNDRYGFRYQNIEYWLKSPSLRNMPKRGNNIPAYYRELIDRLAENPDSIYELPYYVFGALSEIMGKCLGIS